MITDSVDITLKNVCKEIEYCYEVHFIEIGTDIDHIHFLIQSVPDYSPRKIVQIIQSIAAKEIFAKAPKIKKHL